MTITAAGPNLWWCSDVGTSVSKWARPTLQPSRGERDSLTRQRGFLVRGIQSLPFKRQLDLWPETRRGDVCYMCHIWKQQMPIKDRGKASCSRWQLINRESFGLALSGTKTRPDNRDTETHIHPITIQALPWPDLCQIKTLRALFINNIMIMCIQGSKHCCFLFFGTMIINILCTVIKMRLYEATGLSQLHFL